MGKEQRERERAQHRKPKAEADRMLNDHERRIFTLEKKMEAK